MSSLSFNLTASIFGIALYAAYKTSPFSIAAVLVDASGTKRPTILSIYGPLLPQ